MAQNRLWFLGILAVILLATIIALSILLPRRGDDEDGSGDDDVYASAAHVDVPSTPLTSTQFDVEQGSYVTIAKSRTDTLLTLVQLAADGQSFKPVGRSYSGRDWETSAGEFVTSTVFDCMEGDGSSCLVFLPGLPKDGTIYQLTMFEKPGYYTDRDIVARFLEQTTFGPTLDEINSFETSDTLEFAQWIQDQQTNVPVMSHRELYRRYLNAQFPVPNPLGPVTGPCQAQSRYRRPAFSVKDTDRTLTIRTLQGANETDDGRSRRALLVDGHLRTIVDSSATYLATDDVFQEVDWVDGDYVICYVFDYFEKLDYAYPLLLVNHPEYGDCISFLFQLSADTFESNPLVRLVGIEFLEGAGIPTPLVIDIQDQDAEPLDLEYAQNFNPVLQEIKLLDSIAGCAEMNYANSEDPTFVRWSNTLYIHDPRFVLVDNTVNNPLEDGGGANVARLSNPYRPDFTTMCSNVPRTFLNEGGCVLSESPSACAYVTRGDEYGDIGTEPAGSLFRINHDSIRTIYNITGAGEPGTVYLYAIANLNITRDTTVVPPCQASSFSRWTPGPCTGEGPAVTLTTNRLIAAIITWFKEDNKNDYVLDIYHPDDLDTSCAEQDMNATGFEVVDQDDPSNCWRNVHPDHLNVYDFTEWTTLHPGNSATRNPIKEFAEGGNSTLVYPSWHELSLWNNWKALGYAPVRYGDMFSFYYLPYESISEELADALGLNLETISGNTLANSTNGLRGPTLVCGSPFESKNDPELGGNQGRGAFDASTLMYQTSFEALTSQRRTIWIRAILEDPGQLRQRVAWALSQILVISPGGITEGDFLTEAFVSYYDIFVRNAFGNYRDILKEVSYSPLMGDMLTYIGGRSTSVVLEEDGNLQFPDENFAREVLQLFTTGLFLLNINGTETRNSEGGRDSVYTNDDIEEYARAWTGFEQQVQRGNIEGVYDNRIDPMRVIDYLRDRSPKMGLNRQYIGDGYPLCSDLPVRHFLQKGAKYRLLGGSPSPETQRDPEAWLVDKNAVRLALNPDGGLYSKLCSMQHERCIFPSIVILDEHVECMGKECEVDSVRVVQVDNVFYEYIRQPCVHQAFFSVGTVVARKLWPADGTVCSAARIESATPACCKDDGTNYFGELYWGERTTYERAQKRCDGNLCDLERLPSCEEGGAQGSQCQDNSFFWTSVPCTSRMKMNEKGKIAVVHQIPSLGDDEDIALLVHETTQTFFRVDWVDGNSNLDCTEIESCKVTTDNSCVCDVFIDDDVAFVGPKIPTKKEIQSFLHIGAFEPTIEAKTDGEVKFYNPGNEETFSSETVFEFIDEFGVRQLRKNIKSTVSVSGTDLKFRNPPHFISFADETSRDAHFETDATLDHYFYHSNTPPFLSFRFAQRFGISNPSPRYVETIAKAFKSGLYTYSTGGATINFGSGNYGDLSSTFAAVLLDPEARDVSLDSDPSHGAFKEPIIKTMGILRSLRFQVRPDVPWVQFSSASSDAIGQMAHEAPSVFSFFLPEYQPSGRIAKGSLVAPEGQVLTAPRIVDSLNGIFSLLKYGLISCYGGFAPTELLEQLGVYDCEGVLLGETYKGRNLGVLTYKPRDASSAESVVNELATLLTAGRLSPEARQIIQRVYEDLDEEDGIIKAQMMIAASAESHVTNIVRPGRKEREEPPPSSPSSKPYKAVVNILLQGGVDSFNMVAPHKCTATNINGQTLLEQYVAERTTLAFSDEERTRIIDAEGQPCEQFAVHPNLSIVEKLYNDGDLAFFANIGQLDVPVTKDDYYTVTQTELFAHNTMQYTVQRIDPWSKTPGTGILGRMCDVLVRNGFQAHPVSIEDATIATVGRPGEGPVPLVVSARGLNKFAPHHDAEKFDIKTHLRLLNNETDVHSSVFGETYLEKLSSATTLSDRLFDAFEAVDLSQEYPETDSSYISSIRTLSSLILTHDVRGSDRDVFFLILGEWDHHESLKPSLAVEFQSLNDALTLFQQEMQAQGYYDNVTVVVTSDFARTLTANSGSGSDHAWGGNTFMFGGAVKGNVIHGEYPPDVTASGPLNLGRGRLIPTLSWESMFNPVLEWMGVDGDEDLDYCMPNRRKTETKLFSMEEVFHLE